MPDTRLRRSSEDSLNNAPQLPTDPLRSSLKDPLAQGQDVDLLAQQGARMDELSTEPFDDSSEDDVQDRVPSMPVAVAQDDVAEQSGGGEEQGPSTAGRYRAAIERAHATFQSERNGVDEFTQTGLQHQLRVDANNDLKNTLKVKSRWQQRAEKKALKKQAKRLAGPHGNYRNMYTAMKAAEKLMPGQQEVARAEYRDRKTYDPNAQRKQGNAALKARLKGQAEERIGPSENLAKYKKRWRKDKYIEQRTFIDGETGRDRARAEVARKWDNKRLRKRLERENPKASWLELKTLYNAKKQASDWTKPAQERAKHKLRVKRNSALKAQLSNGDNALKRYADQKEMNPEKVREKKKKLAKASTKESAKLANISKLLELKKPNPKDVWDVTSLTKDQKREYFTEFKVWSDSSRKKRNKLLKGVANKSQYQALKYSSDDFKGVDGLSEGADAINAVNDLLFPGGKAAVTLTETVQNAKKPGANATAQQVKDIADTKLEQLGTKYYKPKAGGDWSSTKPDDYDTNAKDYEETTVGGQTNQAGAIIGALTPVLSITSNALTLADGANKAKSNDFATREVGSDQVMKGTFGMTSSVIAGGGAGVNVARTFMSTPGAAAQLGNILPVFKLATSLIKLIEVSKRLDSVRKRLSKIRELRKQQGLKGANPVVWQSLKGVRRADRQLIASSSFDAFVAAAGVAGSTANLIPGGQVVGGPMILAGSIVSGAKAVYDMGAEAHQANQQFKNHKKVKAAWQGQEKAQTTEKANEAEGRAEKYGARILNTDPKIGVQVLIDQARDGDKTAQKYLETFGITPGAYGAEESVAQDKQRNRVSDVALRKMILRRLGAVEDPETFWRQIKAKVSFVRNIHYAGHVKKRGW